MGHPPEVGRHGNFWIRNKPSFTFDERKKPVKVGVTMGSGYSVPPTLSPCSA